MTITKEDQIRAEFDVVREEFESAHEDWKYADTKALWFWFYKACAESYEKKLAEKDAEIANLKAYAGHERSLGAEPFAIKLQSAKRELSEANARNAMLVEAGNKALAGWEAQSTCTPDGILKLEQAITANPEAVAAWEKEKIIEERLYLAQCFRAHDTGMLASAEQIAQMLEGMANELRAANKGKE